MASMHVICNLILCATWDITVQDYLAVTVAEGK